MSEIKTWQEREQDAIGHQAISPASNVIHMRAEIDELRAALADRAREVSKAHAEKMEEFVAHQKLVKELQARLAELEKQEPVAHVVVEPDYWSGGHFYAGSKPYIRYAELHELRIGDKLYTAAGAAPKVATP